MARRKRSRLQIKAEDDCSNKRKNPSQGLESLALLGAIVKILLFKLLYSCDIKT